VWSQIIDPRRAPANPWSSRSVEWLLPTPVPAHNFDTVPTFVSGPYEYGVPGAPPLIAPQTAPATLAD
jgi:cytochrome c oxidase subunit 1